MKADLIIPAAGSGSRFSSGVKKQFYIINGKPILYYTLLSMLKAYDFEKVIIGVDEGDENAVTKIYADTGAKAPLFITKGGKTRAETVYNCLEKSDGEIVAIHDAVRPFVHKKHVEEALEKALNVGGAICALKVRDTIKSADCGAVEKTIPREGLYLAHTPQVFKTDMIRSALWEAMAEKAEITDESSAFERAGYRVEIAQSCPENIKITYQEDIELLEILINKYFA